MLMTQTAHRYLFDYHWILEQHVSVGRSESEMVEVLCASSTNEKYMGE